MKRLALILFFSVHAVAVAVGAEDPAITLFWNAQAADRAGQFDNAIQLYEQIITQYPKAANLQPGWADAELGIAQSLAKKGDLAGAAQAARLSLDCAYSPQSFDAAVKITARILAALDQKVDRANQFLSYEESGPAGGLSNPMDAISYPSQPAREQAFATLRQQAGDDPAASRMRAFTYLLTGKRAEALAQFADEFRRSSDRVDLERAGTDLVWIGLRAMRGHCIGLDEDMQFVVHGPNGPDGKTNIADPFANLLPAPSAAGGGGLAGTSSDDLKVLSQVHDAARLYTGDPLVPLPVRIPALEALARTDGALDNWGAPGQADWYLQLEQGFLEAREARRIVNNLSDFEIRLLDNAQNAARGRALDFAGVDTFWNRVDALYAAQGVAPSPEAQRLRAQFTSMCAALSKLNFKPPDSKPLTPPRTPPIKYY